MATNHVNISLSSTRQEQYKQLQKVAENLGCKVTDLIWAGAEQMLQNPPKNMPKTATAPRAGSARGFWIQHTLNPSTQRLEGVGIVEVAKRADAKGISFIRYAQGDPKSRSRAMNQAQRQAAYDAKLAGIKGDIKVTELPDKEGKAPPKKEEKAGDTSGKANVTGNSGNVSGASNPFGQKAPTKPAAK